jgi:calpain
MKENDNELDVESDPDETKKKISQLENMQECVVNSTTKNKPNMVPNNDKANGIKEDESHEKAQVFFKKVAGEDLQVSWEELKALLDSTFKTEFGFIGFSKDICRSMIALMDVDRSGLLGFDEFNILWKNIQNWHNVFKRFDVDKSGSLSSQELRQALTSAGFCVNNRVLQALVLRYGGKDGCLLFDDFILCAIKLECTIEVFKEKVPDGQKTAVWSMDKWVDKTLYS